MGIGTTRDLEGNPKLGASWEGFAIEELFGARDEREGYFWATYGGAELDLLIVSGGRRWGFEFKVTDAPRTTKSMCVAVADLRLDHLHVVHPGQACFALDEQISAVTLEQAVRLLRAPD